jgi:ATP-dependent DNA helicase RecG
MHLHTRVSALHRVGKTLDKRLAHLGVTTVKDLLWYLPFRYEDYSKTVTIKEVEEQFRHHIDTDPEMVVTIGATLELIANKRSIKKRMMITEAIVSDGTAQLRIVWFGQPFLTRVLKVGDRIMLSGKIQKDMYGLMMKGPVYEKIKDQGSEIKTSADDGVETTHTGRIVPMYSLTSGMTQKQLRFLVRECVNHVDLMKEWLPSDILEAGDFVTLSAALKGIHFPDSHEELHAALRRLKFDELFLLQLRAKSVRESYAQFHAPEIPFFSEEIRAFVQSLPFQLTDDQRGAAWEIFKDIQKGEPMNRLVQGDVGSGKTIVAGLAAYNVALAKKQTAILAPTDILANQHYETITKLLAPSGVKVGIWTRVKKGTGSSDQGSGDTKTRKKKGEKEAELAEVLDADVIIGTHAILQEKVSFRDLGLVIVDEQHRFGVDQRKTLREKSGDAKHSPHFLSMTATPIPRSLALTIYGDLDLSIIRQMPAGRKPIKTRLVEPKNRQKAYDFIREQVKQGRQVFVICPLIEEKKKSSENLPSGEFIIADEKKSVMKTYAELSQDIFPDLRVSFVHGALKPVEKEKVMAAFASGESDILVSTSVVEVGVNIPNATVMMIEDAERFGLAQLHQFRGRVGRSDHQSFCFLFSNNMSYPIQKRLSFFESTTDGFKLAEHDLETRGPGEVYGAAQSGMMRFKLATLSDVDLIKLAREMAAQTDVAKFPAVAERLSEWEEEVHLE